MVKAQHRRAASVVPLSKALNPMLQGHRITADPVLRPQLLNKLGCAEIFFAVL